jgi:hypothetical protein
MGNVLDINQGDDFFTLLITDALRTRKPLPGSTAKESEKYAFGTHQRQEALKDALAIYGTHLRIEAYERAWDGHQPEGMLIIPAVAPHDLSKFWNRMVERWEAIDKDEGHLYLATMRKDFDAIVFTPDVKSELWRIHRDLVLDGKVEPTEGDRAWIASEIQTHQTKIRPLSELMDKIKE